VVFSKLRKGQAPLNYGCLYDGGRVFELPAQCCEERFRLAGRYVAWVQTGSAVGDEDDEIGVFDLRTGRPERIDDQDSLDTASFVTSFLVTRNGTLAWLQTGGGDGSEDGSGIGSTSPGLVVTGSSTAATSGRAR